MNEKEKMKMEYRDHRDVMASILETLSTNGGTGAGLTITRLVYGTGAQWSSLLSLLVELRERKMIVEKAYPGPRIKLKNSNRNHRIFFITPKGIHFLKLYRELKDYLNNKNDIS